MNDASALVKGILKLTGDLGGTADLPTVPGLTAKANLASPTFTGVPSAPTASAATSTTQLATTAFVTTADNLKANIASPTFTGVPSAPTASAATSTTQIATTAFVTTADNLKVTGAASSTDNAIARFDGTTGKLVQNSSLTINDSGRMGIGIVDAAQGIDVRSTNGNSSSVRMTRIADDTSAPALTMFKSRTVTFPSSGDTSLVINAGSRKESTDEEVATAVMTSVTTETQSLTAGGRETRFYSTPNATVSGALRMTIKQDGVVNIPNLSASLPIQTNGSDDLVSAAINLSGAQVTSVLPMANGGSNKALTAVNGGVVYSDADSMEVTAAGTSGQYLKSNGASAPTWVDLTGIVTTGASGTEVFSVSFGTTNATTNCTASPCSYLDQIGTTVSSITRSTAGTYVLNLSKTFTKLKCTGSMGTTGNGATLDSMTGAATSALTFTVKSNTGGSLTDGFGTLICHGDT